MTDTPNSRRAFDAKKRAAMQACIDHARALLNSAKAVQDAGHPNIAYHLATLTLEELGRRELLAVQTVAATKDVPLAWKQKHTQDHIKKLFWCFFGAGFLSEKWTKQRLEGMESLAKQIHAKRLTGLYVDNNDDGLTIPAETITAEQAANLIDLAATRLSMAEATVPSDDISQDDLDLRTWFLTAADDPETRRLIFSDRSLTKLAELAQARPWILWLKQQLDEAEAKARAAAVTELQRSRSLPAIGTKEKWKVRIKIFTGSHSIRPKELTAWNKAIDIIKLSTISKKDELLVDLCLLDNIPAEALWFFGWGLARHFVAALNIGTLGFWWWRMPNQISKYYETIDDLNTKHRVSIERNPILKIDWGANRVLTEQDLDLVTQCFAVLPQFEERDKQEPYGYYLSGINFLSLNDVHWQCESIAFGNFFQSLRGMMKQSGYWKPEDPFAPTLLHFFDEAFPNVDDRAHMAQLFEIFESQAPPNFGVDLKDVAIMKVVCDTFFLREIRPAGLERRAHAIQGKGQPGAATTEASLVSRARITKPRSP
jgi:AbiV family abortive infection protein